MAAGDSESAALPWLWNMRVQRVDGPARDCLSLTFFERGDKFSLVLLFGAVRGLGARRERPKGDAASAFIQRLRSIEGGRLAAASWLHDTDPTRAVALRLE